MQKLKEFGELIETPKKVVITTHFKPDADALGSSLGLAGYLMKKGHEVNVISPSDYPEFLNWMEGQEDVINFEADSDGRSAELMAAADLGCAE